MWNLVCQAGCTAACVQGAGGGLHATLMTCHRVAQILRRFSDPSKNPNPKKSLMTTVIIQIPQKLDPKKNPQKSS